GAEQFILEKQGDACIAPSSSTAEFEISHSFVKERSDGGTILNRLRPNLLRGTPADHKAEQPAIIR
ncbi:MAG: hypothetical protein ACRD3W_23565, partial [Terriglobales bacterium]